MELGWCDVCFRVRSSAESRRFYEGLGFWKVEGDDEKGWTVVTNGEVRLGLYEAAHMGAEAVTLNFRGGDIGRITGELKDRGYVFESATTGVEGAGSATLRDPDGYALFFDTAPGEVKKDQPVVEV